MLCFSIVCFRFVCLFSRFALFVHRMPQIIEKQDGSLVICMLGFYFIQKLNVCANEVLLNRVNK